jgi:WD40 repeat protein
VLRNRSSQVRREGLVVRIVLDEKADIAASSKQSDDKWKELRSGLADLMKIDSTRLDLIRVMGGSLKFDVGLLPNPMGFNVAPTAADLLARLQKLYDSMQINRKFPKLVGFEVLLGPEEPEDDFMGIKPWLGVVSAPTDWQRDRGSKLLNYAPTVRQQREAASSDAADGEEEGEGRMVEEPRPPCLIAYEQEVLQAVDSDIVDPAGWREVLKLEYVYGYQGWRGASNLFYLDPEHLVYSAGSIGVVQHVASTTQRFMRAPPLHTDQISALAMKPSAPGEAAGCFATGELGPRGCIRLWAAAKAAGEAPRETACLKGFHSCDIAAVCFLDGDMVVSVGCDAEHQVAVWSISEGNLKCSARGDVNSILAVGAAEEGAFVSVGVNHIKFWHFEDGKPLAARGGIFGNKGRVQTMLCVAAFLEESVTTQLVALTGTEDGSIYVWKDRLLTSALHGAHAGPVFALCVPESNPELVLSGGKDGCIRVCSYDASQGLHSLQVIDNSRLELRPRFTPMHSSVRALAASSAGGGWLRVAFGTGANNIVQVELDVRNLQSIRVLSHTLQRVANGHAGGRLAGLCSHPDFPEFATVGDDALMRLWNSATHELTACLALGHAGSVVDYNAGPHQHMAVALTNGAVLVLDAPSVRQGLDASACTVCKLSNRRSEITDVKYSPDGQYLAVASYDNVIDVYLVTKGYNRWGVCRGHRDTIRHLDWASDIKGDVALLRSNDTAQELLHWNVTEMHKGQIEAIERAHELKDVHWSRGTCPMTWGSQGAIAYYEAVTDVAAVDRSRNGALLVAGDDFGGLRVFRYPALEGCESMCFRAHAGTVSNVTFTFDDSSLLSMSSADMCLLQWKVALVPRARDEDAAEDLQLQIAPRARALAGHGPAAEVEDNSLQLFKPFHACVFAPAGWQPHDDFLRAPRQELELEMVHGCRGHDRHAHLCYNSSFHAVYYTAKIVVVQDREYGLQRFFLGHSEDIACLAPHPRGRLFASGQTGSSALICVWDSQRQESRLLHAAGARQRSLQQVASFTAPNAAGVVVMSFSSCGCYLFTVSENIDYEVTVWDWQRSKALSVLKGSPNRTLAIATNRLHGPPATDENFMTCGVKNVRFWTVVGGELRCRKADLSSRGVLSIQLTCAFSKEYGITGNDQGFLYFWKDARLIKTCRAHHGPVFSLSTAAHQYHGTAIFCSAAGDGIVKLWKLDQRATSNVSVLRWKNIGVTKPEHGRELTNSSLSAALTSKEHFTEREWGDLGVSALRHDDFILSRDTFFKPAALSDKDLPAFVSERKDSAQEDEAARSEIDVHCFEPEGVSIQRVIEDLNAPSVGQAVCLRAAYLQFEPGIKTVSNATTNGVWRILLGTSVNEIYQLTLPQLHSAPNDMTTEVHSGQLERETVKVYISVKYGDEGVGGEKLPAIQLLVQAHCPAAGRGGLVPQRSDLSHLSDLTAQAHVGTNSVRALAALAVHPNDENEFATCGADGVLRIWEAQHGRVRFICRLQDQLGGAEQVVQSMCYSPANGECYHLALGANGKVIIMDASVPLGFGEDITVLDTLDKSKGIGSRGRCSAGRVRSR